MIAALLVPVPLLAIAVLIFFVLFILIFDSMKGIKQYVNVNLVCIFMTTSALKHILIYLYVVWICSC